MYLKNKNILITGAGKGIGHETVKKCIDYGAYVYALVRNKKDNKKFSHIRNIKIINGDVTNIKLLNNILINSKKNSRPINCLINNAGLRFRKKFLKVNKLEIQKIFDVNFFSIFLIMQIFSKFVIKNKLSNPSIINISSIVGITGFDELSVYASSKNALSALTKSYAVEMSKFGIRANTVSPGFTKTSYYKKFKKNKKLYNWTLSRIPQKRWGESQEIAELICFVLSEKSKYLNGENISIDGGWTNA